MVEKITRKMVMNKGVGIEGLVYVCSEHAKLFKKIDDGAYADELVCELGHCKKGADFLVKKSDLKKEVK